MSNATPPPTPSPAVSELAKKCHQLLGYPEKLVLLEDIEAFFIRSEKDRATIARLESENVKLKDQISELKYNRPQEDRLSDIS